MISLNRRQHVRLSLYCKCGASWKMTLPESDANSLRHRFRSEHTGQDCGPCDAKECARARRAAAEQSAMEERENP